MPRALKDAYLLFLNRPPDDVPPGDGGATIVAARSLRHPELPQPDALRLFDRLARQPARHAGTLVFLSDLTGELANEGLTWPEVGIDYEAVTDGVVALHRRRALRALRLTQLSDVAVTLLASGPHAQVFVAESDGQSPKLLDPILFQVRREELRTMIRTDLERMVARGSFHLESAGPAFRRAQGEPCSLPKRHWPAVSTRLVVVSSSERAVHRRVAMSCRTTLTRSRVPHLPPRASSGLASWTAP